MGNRSDSRGMAARVAPAARVESQLLVSAKFALAAILAIVSVAVPALVSVTGSGWLAVPTTSSPNVKPLVEKETLGDPTPPQPVSTQDLRSTSRR